MDEEFSEEDKKIVETLLKNKKFVTKKALKIIKEKNLLERVLKLNEIIINENILERLQEREIKIERNREKKIAEEHDVDFRLENVEIKHRERKVSDFVSYFNSKFFLLQQMMIKRINPISIANIKKTANDEISLIGMVYDLRTTSTGNRIIELEDPTGKISCIVTNSNSELFEEANNILLDEVIGVRGVFKNNYLYINEIIRPDVPATNEIKKLDIPLSCVFISDLHVGSIDFLEHLFNKFIKWINSKEAEKVKYIFIGGDLCVLPETLILTKKGLKKIEDIKIGEEVLTHSNRWQKVKKVFKREIDEEVCGLSTDSSNIPDIILTGNHPVWATIRKNRYFSVRGMPSWIPAHQLSKGYSLFNIRTEEPFSSIEEVEFSDTPKQDKIRSSSLQKKVKLDKDFLTVIGLFLGDGTVKLNKKRGTVSFYFEKRKKNNLPIEIVERWARKLKLNLLVHQQNNLKMMYINSKPLAKFFSQFYKNKIKDIPEFWLNLPLEQFKWIVYGLVLSDGCFEKRKIGGRVRINNTSINLLKKIRLRLEFSGIYTSLCLSRGEIFSKFGKRISKTKNYFELSFSNETTMPILELFRFKEGLRRNPREFRESFFYSLKKLKKNIKQKYKGFVYNLEVENDNSYIANGIILHNCDGVGIYLNQEKDLSIKSYEKQYEYLTELLAKIPEHIKIIVQPGNHDIVGNQEPQQTLKETALSKLQNIEFGTNPCSVVLNKNFRILMYHGYSYDDVIREMPKIRQEGYKKPCLPMIEVLKRRHLAPSYGSSLVIPKQTDDLVIKEIPDIFHSGHLHTVCLENYKNILLINSGTFQGRTKYQEMQGHIPHPGIFAYVDLQTRESKLINLN